MIAPGLAGLSRATGIERETIVSIWEEVRANSARLESCARHAFPDPEPGRLAGRYTCANCQGWADGSAVFWYRRGLAHGAAAPE